MIKLVVSDLDGTLLPYDRTSVSKEVFSYIDELIGKGIVFSVSSGRTYNELEHLLCRYKDKIYFNCCDGALTVFNGKPVYERRIEPGDMELFFKHIGEAYSFVLHGAFKNYCVGKLPAEASVYEPTPINGFFEVREKIFKITAYGSDIKIPEYCGLRTHWDGTNKTVQYVNRFCNKGNALSDLQIRLMLTKYDTACLGDRGNDICMVKGAKFSYCIGDRCAELADMCTFNYDNIEVSLKDLLGKIF